MDLNCILPLPYPEINVERKNRKNATILLQLLYGANGELSTVADYTYQSVILKDMYPKMSDVLDCVSITELNHFKILASAVFMLGAPRYSHDKNNTSYRFKNKYAYVNDNSDPQELLKENIFNEKKSISLYKHAYKEINDKYVKAIINRIIIDEEHHIDLFSSLVK